MEKMSLTEEEKKVCILLKTKMTGIKPVTKLKKTKWPIPKLFSKGNFRDLSTKLSSDN